MSIIKQKDLGISRFIFRLTSIDLAVFDYIVREKTKTYQTMVGVLASLLFREV